VTSVKHLCWFTIQPLSETWRTDGRQSSPITNQQRRHPHPPHLLEQVCTSLSLLLLLDYTGIVSNLVAGSKASSPTEQKNQTDYQFLNFSHPSEAKDSRARKTARSHVTKQQHQREHAAAAARRAKSFPQPEDQGDPEMAPISRGHAATFPSNRPTLKSPASSRQVTGSPEAASQSPSTSNSPTEQRSDYLHHYPRQWHPYLDIVIVSTLLVVPNTSIDSAVGTLPLEHGTLHTERGWQ